MAAGIVELDAHEQPSEAMRAQWKGYSRADQKELINGDSIDDPRSSEQAGKFSVAGKISVDQLTTAFSHISSAAVDTSTLEEIPILYHPLLPGLLIVPNLVPPDIQKTLLSLMINRDLSVPTHQTNLHLHYELPYPKASDGSSESFFSYPPDQTPIFTPKDPSVHKPLSIKQVMERRLHWVTLGGQYDWTNRIYPEELPPQFPSDIAQFLETVFPQTLAQAAIVNFYTPGDTMMMHRDVSEETDKGLVSLSFGCDGLFMIAPNDPEKISDEAKATGKEYLLLRLRSGDAIYMTKDSRFAWHGVPKVMKGTCPEYLADWPAEDGKYEEWRGWMQNKRINLNVRQMRD
ncbi:alkylated DNA repair protein [Colletotrichum tofieldiae]|uniref:mRNA N(6)-methyladenine demethylase n=1 Tax=Colletotrichum tofieldiae TaxID=708197 RepID=A0A166X6E4_9PEZI|nr:alkylated DNA repair protein [Colletotrichum tofieldiae]GKT57751.1 alkylated DNA repair protein [Colletotrichum tofieldiae]GKT77312.1 alkylated DNA repair protein [Colletotrichum tofieldiae]GKT86295.1 alkylated DNA repair protein [Colletotrichum tofieldiae]